VKLLVDLNVLLDVVQDRTPHYRDSAEILSRSRTGVLHSLIPAHALTTLHYIVNKAAGRTKADEVVDWLLAHFEIVAADRPIFQRARELAIADFEDAVVASLAEAAKCDHIVTRNQRDFTGSTVPAISPGGLLALLSTTTPPRGPGGALPQ
jgi:predicted nucleic acid-binding protein